MQNHEIFKFIKPPQKLVCDVCGIYPKRVIVMQEDPDYPSQDEHIYLCEKHLKELKDFLNKNV